MCLGLADDHLGGFENGFTPEYRFINSFKRAGVERIEYDKEIISFVLVFVLAALLFNSFIFKT